MNLPTSSEDLDSALLHCAQEKIHLIGQLQGGHILIAVDLASCEFTYLSENAGDALGMPIDALWSSIPAECIGDAQLKALSRQASSHRGRGPRLSEILLPGSSPRLAWIHLADGNLVIEISLQVEAEDATSSGWAWENEMRDSLTLLESAKALDEKLSVVVAEVARLGLFDRVMVYRFHKDDSGEVAAEEVRSEWEPYVGLRYPASDIPPQARALFLRNEVRMIREVAALPVAILGSPKGPQIPLDLSLSAFRQPSPVHLEYLQNMGVAASFVSAILVDGLLWGLISCHHGQEFRLSAIQQAQLGALTRHLGGNISALAREMRLRNDLDCARISSKLIQCITVTHDWTAVLMSMAEEICELLQADGLFLRFSGKCYSFGLAPSQDAMNVLVSHGLDKGGGLSFSSTRDKNPAAYDLITEEIGGFLVIPLSHFQDDALVFFRKEQTIDIIWAGSPSKKVDRSDQGVRLRPRTSFAEWKESNHGTCETWSENDLAFASTIRITLSDIVITAHYFRQALESPPTIRFRLTHEADTEPVLIADDNGIVVYQNFAATADVFLRDLHSLDSITTRAAPSQSKEIARNFHSLVYEGEDIRFLVHLSEGNPRWLEGKRLIENGELMGYSIRLLRSSQEPARLPLENVHEIKETRHLTELSPETI